jgi:hypothetical protein
MVHPEVLLRLLRLRLVYRCLAIGLAGRVIARIIVRISVVASIVVRMRGTFGVIIRVTVMLRRTVVRTGVECASAARIGWIVIIDAVTIFPSVVFGLNLTSTSALLVIVGYRFTYASAMVIVVGYFPSVLWTTTIFTVERIKSRWTAFFVWFITRVVMLLLSRDFFSVSSFPCQIQISQVIRKLGSVGACYKPVERLEARSVVDDLV